jgi:hypothetical protein
MLAVHLGYAPGSVSLSVTVESLIVAAGAAASERGPQASLGHVWKEEVLSAGCGLVQCILLVGCTLAAHG